MSDGEVLPEAAEIADEVLRAFAALHPAVCLTFHEWQDLREMIERQCGGLPAASLVNDTLYTCNRRRL